MCLVVITGAAAAWWVFITPDNPQTSLCRRQISGADARNVIGPYPAEHDFRALKQNNVGLVVSLLDPAIPYEATPLAREKALAARYQIRLKAALTLTPDNQELRDVLERARTSQ